VKANLAGFSFHVEITDNGDNPERTGKTGNDGMGAI
jgi:hypothetical protein